MIYGLLHPGSGLGNMLHRYVATRVLAMDKGCEFSMINSEGFKGKSFMDIYMGESNDISWHAEYPAGKIVVDDSHSYWDEGTNYYNPEFNFIEDDTIIDGEFQDERYFGHRLNEVDTWLKVQPMNIPDDLCIINFRGGEYALYPDLFLTKEYWAEAKILMLQQSLKMRFEVHTDDLALAKQLFPDYKIVRDIGTNWRSLRYSRYAIIANSSFAILPRLLRHGQGEDAFTVAPRYWARRNIKQWSMPQNYYKKFFYI